MCGSVYELGWVLFLIEARTSDNCNSGCLNNWLGDRYCDQVIRYWIINPWRACTAKVTAVVLCVSVCICVYVCYPYSSKPSNKRLQRL